MFVLAGLTGVPEGIGGALIWALIGGVFLLLVIWLIMELMG